MIKLSTKRGMGKVRREDAMRFDVEGRRNELGEFIHRNDFVIGAKRVHKRNAVRWSRKESRLEVEAGFNDVIWGPEIDAEIARQDHEEWIAEQAVNMDSWLEQEYKHIVAEFRRKKAEINARLDAIPLEIRDRMDERPMMPIIDWM